MSAVRVELLPEIDVSKIRFRDWSGLGEAELCARLGLSRRFYYSALHRGETVCGLPLHHYHILCRMRGDGWTAEQAAAELGASVPLCRRVVRQYEGAGVPLDMTRLPAYAPAKLRREVRPGLVLSALRDLTRGGDGVIDRIDGTTLRRMREAAGC